MIVEEIVRQILRQAYDRKRGFIPCRLSKDLASEIISGVKEAFGGLPIRVGLAKKGEQITGIWWAYRRKK